MKTPLQILGILIATAVILLSMGRLPFCKCGVITLWSGNVWSNQNSQQFTDPYTFTHVLHGVGFYALTWILARRTPVQTRLVLAVILESSWEILENTDFIINRYRAATMSFDYYGDSILNSIGDILAMMGGFAIAMKTPARMTAVGAILMDIALLVAIRDSLLLNIIMLIYPIESIRAWQMQP